MKLSNKKVKEINRISFAVDILKKKELHTIVGHHWTETPPDMWSDDEKNKWDMMHELEDKLKAAIITLLSDGKEKI